MKNFVFMLLAFFSLSLVSCDKDDDNTPTDKTDDVVEIAIRQVKNGQLSISSKPVLISSTY